jgi:hypothetical protein
MLQLPTTLAEHAAAFSGIASGFALSPRSVAIGIIALVLGVFRVSAAWALLLAGFAGISHLYLLSTAARYIDMSLEYRSYFQWLTLGAAVIVSLLWYSLGRVLRSLKVPMISSEGPIHLKPIAKVTDIDVGLELANPPMQSVESSLPRQANQFIRNLTGIVVGGAFFLLIAGLVAGLGIRVYDSLSPETPVLFGYVKQPGQGLVWRYATVECVRSGNSLEGYVWNRAEMMHPINVFDLQPEISIGSLAHARDLARKVRALRDADPICSQANGFMGRSELLMFSLFR